MNRRRFLGSLNFGVAGLLAGSELDLERLLWRPKPIITVPSMPGRGLVSLFWEDGARTVFRNVAIGGPVSLHCADEERYRVARRVETTIEVLGRAHTVVNSYLNVPIHPGNTLTLECQGPLVTLEWA